MKKINPLTACLNSEKGMVLIVALLVAAVLIILGTTAFMTTTTDLKISSAKKQSDKAFYSAEAGLEEARGRMKANYTTSYRIDDTNPTDTGWMYFIGTESKSQALGFNSGNTLHSRTASLQTALGYTVAIKHQTDTSGNILYWGDTDGDGSCERNTSTGRNIYLVRSYGVYSGAQRAIEAEISKVPPITAPGALYVEATTTIQGTSTNVIGLDQCGGGTDMPGVVTTLDASTVSRTGNPVVSGSTSPTWSVQGGATNMDVQSIVDSWKGSADYVYNKVSTTDTGMNWGTPTLGATLQNPSSCSVNNVVYYNTYNGTNNTYIKLTGGSSGCGVLVVDGDLELHGNFTWYGVILVSGSITYSGGGNKNVTGAVIAGGSVDADLVGGNANIVYCSSAISDQTVNQPLRRLSWKLMGQ
ncbi:PilX N-terminal [Syntrophus gentianae]|uniref:PilX N-terminal n=1 Tax=Syntrophus gentianae TaxID=43775 RepID=A0A1H7VB21_9BACT|nr:pilus assembly PilX N-terminal domain-containing protein [Syntrophus gentianae]SEM06416.1 PilX N-terminal [Syntrophus gentianae]